MLYQREFQTVVEVKNSLIIIISIRHCIFINRLICACSVYIVVNDFVLKKKLLQKDAIH